MGENEKMGMNAAMVNAITELIRTTKHIGADVSDTRKELACLKQDMAKIQTTMEHYTACQTRVNSKLNSAHDKVRVLEDQNLNRLENCPHTPAIQRMEKRTISEDAIKVYTKTAITKTAVWVSIIASLVGAATGVLGVLITA